MVSKFIFLVMRDFFLENNAFEQIIVNDEIHTYIHTYFIGSSPRGFSESILHYKIINQVHDNKNITMIKEDTASCPSNMFPSVLNVTNNKNKLLKTVRLIIVLKPTISNRFKFYFLQSSLSIRA